MTQGVLAPHTQKYKQHVPGGWSKAYRIWCNPHSLQTNPCTPLMPAAWLPALQRCLCSISHCCLSNVQLPSLAEPLSPHTPITLESQELTRASRADGNKNTSVPCSAPCNNPHTHTLSLCSWFMQLFSFDFFPSQPSKQPEAGQQIYWLCHPWLQCLHSNRLRGTV